MGQYEKALDYYEKSLVIQEEILLPDDPDLADGFASIAVTYQNIGQFDKALEFELRSLAIKEKYWIRWILLWLYVTIISL